jgi:hypothetical protein
LIHQEAASVGGLFHFPFAFSPSSTRQRMAAERFSSRFLPQASTFDVLLAAATTTLPGIVAKLAYLQDIANRDASMLTDRPDAAIRLLEGFVAPVANVWRVQS